MNFRARDGNKIKDFCDAINQVEISKTFESNIGYYIQAKAALMQLRKQTPDFKLGNNLVYLALAKGLSRTSTRYTPHSQWLSDIKQEIKIHFLYEALNLIQTNETDEDNDDSFRRIHWRLDSLKKYSQDWTLKIRPKYYLQIQVPGTDANSNI